MTADAAKFRSVVLNQGQTCPRGDTAIVWRHLTVTTRGLLLACYCRMLNILQGTGLSPIYPPATAPNRIMCPKMSLSWLRKSILACVPDRDEEVESHTANNGRPREGRKSVGPEFSGFKNRLRETHSKASHNLPKPIPFSVSDRLSHAMSPIWTPMHQARSPCLSLPRTVNMAGGDLAASAHCVSLLCSSSLSI